MAKNSNQKLKLLYIAKMLFEKTDDNHVLSTNDIISNLAACGISAERKSIYDDLEALRSFGLDIESGRDKSRGYYIASRNFELPELKLLVDAVQSSKFITQKKTLSLIKKIEGLTSVYNAGGLQRQVYVLNRIKTMNESIYYNVDSINDAITFNSQITFRYFEWNEKKEKILRHGGASYKASPLALCWDDENYYLIAFDSKSREIRHYRVDKMLSISQTGEKREAAEDFEKFDAALYSKSIFGMYNGREETVAFLCDNSLAGIIIDRFGTEVNFLKTEEDKFQFSVKVAVSPLFLSWVIGFGNKIKVLSPNSVAAELRTLAEEALAQYK